LTRIEASITSVSWIPREAIEGTTKLPFELGITHYDMPPPDVVDDVAALVARDQARFCNELRAWIEVEDGRITGYGHLGRGHMGGSTMRFGPVGMRFAAVPLPDIRPEPDASDTEVRFVQTAGGRPALPAPRYVRRKPFVQISGPTVWSTLALTIRADGSHEHEVLGASSFPRHWFYDHGRRLVQKAAVIDFDTWYHESFGERTPWGSYDSAPIVTAVESALERQLSLLMIESQPVFKRLAPGDILVRQGDPGDELFLLFDGVLEVERDGEPIVQVGPGAILGEMALLQGGRRTATLRAATACRVAIAPGDLVDRDALARIAEGRL
jgi:hypothetical protein